MKRLLPPFPFYWLVNSYLLCLMIVFNILFYFIFFFLFFFFFDSTTVRSCTDAVWTSTVRNASRRRVVIIFYATYSSWIIAMNVVSSILILSYDLASISPITRWFLGSKLPFFNPVCNSGNSTRVRIWTNCDWTGRGGGVIDVGLPVSSATE